MVNQKHNIVLLTLSLILILTSGCETQSTQQAATTDTGTQQDLQSANEIALFEALALFDKQQVDSTQIEARLLLLGQRRLNSRESQLLQFARAKLLHLQTDDEAALAALNALDADDIYANGQTALFIQIYQLKAKLLVGQGELVAAAKQLNYIAPLIESQADFIANQQQLWQILSLLDKGTLENTLANASNNEFKQWLNLSLIAQHSDLALDLQIAAVNRWQAENATHPGALIPPFEIGAIRIAARKRPSTIGVLLPFDEKYQQVGKAIRDGIMAAFYSSDYRPRIIFYSVDQEQNFLSVYNDAIADGAELIIGPLFQEQLQNLYAQAELSVTTIALNKSNSLNKPINLIEYSLSQDDEIDALISLANDKQLNNAIILAQEANWAEKIAAQFTEKWQQHGHQVLAEGVFTSNKEQSAVIQKALAIDQSKDRIKKLKWAIGNIEADPRRRQDVDMILILSKPSLAASLRPLLSFHYASDIDLFATSSIYRGYSNQQLDRDLNGIQFTDIPLIIENPASVAKSYQNSPLIRMYAFGQDAFRLSERVHLMQQLPALKLYGATGTLALDGQQIQRKTAFAKFTAGKAVAMSSHIEQSNDADKND